MDNLNFNLPKKSIAYIFVCAGIIVIFAVLIGSLYYKNAERKKDIQKTKQLIEDQKTLGPVYQKIIAAAENKLIKKLPYPNKTRLPRQDAVKFMEDFMQAAKKSSVMTISLAPDLTSLSGSSHFLLHKAAVKGQFENFREFLIALGGISYIEKIEEISIQQLSDSMELKMKIWIALGG